MYAVRIEDKGTGELVIYGSVCSGICAPTAAWKPLGWTPAFFSEIDRFPSAVLTHHYPDVPNLGDMTRFREWPDYAIDLLVGGTPCQSFSVAGLRGGMADPRGNLALVFLAVADRYRPRWIVWENVPGVLSSNGGRDFASFLGGLAELGYGFAYRILDAQHFGVPQRRRRVFVVGHSGDWRRAAAVLFEPASLRRDPPPSRETGEGIAASVAPSLAASGRGVARAGESRGQDPLVAMSLNARGRVGRMDGESETFMAETVRSHPRPGSNSLGPLAHSLRADGFDASEDGTGRGVPIVFDETQVTHPENRCNPQPGDPSHPLAAGARPPAIAFHKRQDPDVSGNVTHPIGAKDNGMGLLFRSSVRRLTPREAERLQGFPDDFTLIPYRGKPAKDGPRYKALGNSMAVPVVRWIGQRIEREESR